jgi:hypothetical protein
MNNMCKRRGTRFVPPTGLIEMGITPEMDRGEPHEVPDELVERGAHIISEGDSGRLEPSTCETCDHRIKDTVLTSMRKVGTYRCSNEVSIRYREIVKSNDSCEHYEPKKD